MSKKKNILITGGAGYIGLSLYRKLKKKNNITIVDSKSKKKIIYRNDIKNYFRINILNKKKLDNFFKKKKFDLIIHLASKINAKESVKKKKYYYKHIFIGSKNVIDLSIKYKIKYFIFSSSAAVYGSYKKKFNEKDKLKPINPYGLLKKKVEELIIQKSKNNYKYLILRFFNVAGIKHSNNVDMSISKSVISIIIQKIKKNKIFHLLGNKFNTKDGTTERDFIHVSDIVKIIENSIQYLIQKNKNNIVNCGTGKKTSIKDIICLVKKNITLKIFNKNLGDPDSVVSDNKKLIKLKLIRKFKNINQIVNSYYY